MTGPAPPYPRAPGPNAGPQMNPQQGQQFQVRVNRFIYKKEFCLFFKIMIHKRAGKLSENETTIDSNATSSRK